MTMLKPSTSLVELHLHEIPRVAMKTAQKLAAAVAANVNAANPRAATIGDLLHHLPMRYEDRSNLTKIGGLKNGEYATIEVEVRVAGTYAVKGGKLRIFECSAVDRTGQIRAIWWNQAYLQKTLTRGTRVLLYGQWKRGRRGFFEIENPDYELLSDEEEQIDPIHRARRVPVYRKLGEIRTKQLRSIMYYVLERLDASSIKELLPADIIARNGLIGRLEAYRQIHFPAEDSPIEMYNQMRSPAHQRLIFEEFFWLVFAVGLRKQGREEAPKGAIIKTGDRVREAVRRVLPFKPTSAQKRVLREIVNDMTGPKPMNRLLQGDVGSGKTIVAIQAAVVAMESGYQAAMMVPTEILAEQHSRNVKRLLSKSPYRVELLMGSLSAAKKRELYEAVSSGEINLLIGTHALIQEGVRFQKLGFVVIDEQHRFGVLQRAELMKRGYNPDVLVMTATPIPRSLAMTVYGDLDVSIIDEMPPGRKPVITKVRSEDARAKIYKFLEQTIQKGRQVYIVYPLVEESEKLDLMAATQMAERLSTEIFPGHRVVLVHGKMKQDEKDRAMEEFRTGSAEIMVATTVIEVGVDVPNANVMVIEHAERFGLSQLHQLRGRVGRGGEQAYCILLAGDKRTSEARERLAIMEETTDGFRIAEKDMEIRGPGEMMGTRQAGLPDFRIGNLVRDQTLLEAAKREADLLIKEKQETHEFSRLVEIVKKQPKYRLASIG
ncbi:MAG: ATP-dependent DNA helicase RecG [Blastocatellia bacterium AA13]|nr:MAG: ATP-dependent DNA helicase RecG [Blastocatellia bacterium AA13]